MMFFAQLIYILSLSQTLEGNISQLLFVKQNLCLLNHNFVLYDANVSYLFNQLKLKL